MTSFFTLDLDTTSPAITWGAMFDGVAGRVLRIYYTTDEALDTTEIVLADGTHVAGTVFSDRLEFMIPADAPDGVANVYAWDSVLNPANSVATSIVGASFILTLDTTPPAVVWGAVGGNAAGQLMQVAYTVGAEPIDSAEVILADNRHITGTVLADRLEFLLPYDAPDGAATVFAYDDVLNGASLVVNIGGVVSTRVPQTYSMPRPRRRRPLAIAVASSPEHIVTRSLSSAHKSLLNPQYPETVVLRSESDVAYERQLSLSEINLAVMSTSSSRSQIAVSGDFIRRLGSESATSRRDGRAIEELLLLELV